MSTLDQPILIANSNYHVGHQVALAVAREQGYMIQEGLTQYEYDARGLIPGPLERDALALAMKKHGVDIATAVDVEAAILQRPGRGNLYRWRLALHAFSQMVRRQAPDRPEHKLRGGRIGMREKESLVEVFITDALRQGGIDPFKDVQWVYDPVFSYRNNSGHIEMLRSGKIDAITSQPPFADQLEREGWSSTQRKLSRPGQAN